MSQLSDSYYVKDASGKRPFKATVQQKNGVDYLEIKYGRQGTPPMTSSYTNLNLNGDDEIAQTINANKLLFQELIKSVGNLDLSLGVDKLEEKIKAKDASIQQKDVALQRLGNALTALQTKLNEKVSAAESALAKAESDATAAANAATDSGNTTNALSAEIAQLKNDKKTLNDQNNMLSKDLQSAVAEKKAAEDALVQAKSDHEQELQKERNDANDLANTLQDEINAAKQKIQQLQLETQQLQQYKNQANNTLLERDEEIRQLRAKLTNPGQGNGANTGGDDGASENDDNNTTPVPPPVPVSTTTPSAEELKKASDLRQEAKEQLIQAINTSTKKTFADLPQKDMKTVLRELQKDIPKSVVEGIVLGSTKKVTVANLRKALGDEIYQEIEQYTPPVTPSNGGGIFGAIGNSIGNALGLGGAPEPEPAPSVNATTAAAAIGAGEGKQSQQATSAAADTNTTNNSVSDGGSANDVASVKKYIEITDNLSDEEKNKLEQIWKTQIPKIPMQYASQWVTAKRKNRKLTAAEFAESKKGEFVNAGVVFYFELNNKILVSANVDVNDEKNLEIYNLTKTESATEPYSATNFINFVYETLFKEDGSKSDSEFYNTVFQKAKDDAQLFLKPANGKIKKLYDDMVKDKKISEHILVGDNEHSEMPYDFRFNKGVDVDNPIRLAMYVPPNFPKKQKDLQKYTPFFVNKKGQVYKVTKDSNGKFSAQKVNNASEWLSKGWYNPKNPNPS